MAELIEQERHRRELSVTETGINRSEDLLMSSSKLNELARDVDDAATVVEELQDEPDVDASEKLDELKATLEDASDVLDELHDENYE